MKICDIGEYLISVNDLVPGDYLVESEITSEIRFVHVSLSDRGILYFQPQGALTQYPVLGLEDLRWFGPFARKA